MRGTAMHRRALFLQNIAQDRHVCCHAASRQRPANENLPGRWICFGPNQGFKPSFLDAVSEFNGRCRKG